MPKYPWELAFCGSYCFNGTLAFDVQELRSLPVARCPRACDAACQGGSLFENDTRAVYLAGNDLPAS